MSTVADSRRANSISLPFWSRITTPYSVSRLGIPISALLMVTLVPSFFAAIAASLLPIHSCIAGILNVRMNKRYSPKTVHTTMLIMYFNTFKTDKLG